GGNSLAQIVLRGVIESVHELRVEASRLESAAEDAPSLGGVQTKRALFLPRFQVAGTIHQTPGSVVDHPADLVFCRVFTEGYVAFQRLPLHVIGMDLYGGDERLHGRL